MNDMNVEVSEDNLSAKLSGGAVHLLADALVSCFKGSGAINHLECSFEDPEDSEGYTILMQKNSGITQGEKIAGLEKDVENLRNALEGAMSIKDLWLPMHIVTNEHEGEAVALHKMYRNFEKALSN
ncbi:coil containing protein [Vibrio phage 1.191.O._10N.286.52.B4]|nr:coil containing protein [Vibrio phage 1.191.O._10N.286.52.B4]